MVFAEGARPAPALCKAWDAYALTTPGTQIVGWWDDEPLAEVSGKSSSMRAAAGEVKASVYVIPGSRPRYVLAIASWAPGNVTVSVQFGAAIGSHPKVSAIPIDNFLYLIDNLWTYSMSQTAGDNHSQDMTTNPSVIVKARAVSAHHVARLWVGADTTRASKYRRINYSEAKDQEYRDAKLLAL